VYVSVVLRPWGDFVSRHRTTRTIDTPAPRMLISSLPPAGRGMPDRLNRSLAVKYTRLLGF